MYVMSSFSKMIAW